MLQAYSERLLATTLKDLVRRGTLDVALPGGRRLNFGDGTAPRASIRFTDARAVLTLLLDPDLRLGELFMDERLVVEEGTIYDVLELLLRDADAAPPNAAVRFLDAVRMSMRRFLQNNRPGRARASARRSWKFRASSPACATST